ncbi:ATP synthase mitochondrial F1 complex assembly factor 1-like [Uloborus diversus]|uniref:ATP synthase mitochondrial F1 complex assembly factor 1-like n=1 Tax=Uloborus diversus TaxID=327109 RepID=UPI002409A9D7|nr:ATP synthase mitochondrial F1 complex assembly factor 1-like [Uloborus diversus]
MMSPKELKSHLEVTPKEHKDATYIDRVPEKLSSSQVQDKKKFGQKELHQIVKVEAMQSKSADEIEEIWKQYHQNKDGLYAVLPKVTYEKLYTRSQKYPTFLFPLPRAQGYEFIMLQFLQHSCYFTSLINYQAFQENAPVCLTINYFTEFQNDKGIVLMKGEYDDKVLKVHEAQCLANQLQLYYGGTDEKKERLLWNFNEQPETFRHMDLISNFEYNLGK